MERTRRDRLASFVLLPAVLVAVGIIAYFTFRTTLQIEKLSQESILGATYDLATERADRLDRRLVDEDNAVLAIADPPSLSDLTERWIPTAQRETPTIRAILVLDEWYTVLAFASRAGGAWAEEEAFRRLLVQRMLADMDLERSPREELRHLHKDYRGQSYLVSYWQRMTSDHRYLIVAWHDIGRIVKDTLPSLFFEATASPNRFNVVDEQGRIIFGPPLRSGGFTVGVKFPTTLYGWRLQLSPSTSEQLTARVQNQRLLETVMVVLSSIVIVLGVATILLAAEKERRISALKSEFVANVSHELKTPLSLVRMFAEMLQSGRVANDAKRQEYLDIIVSESERLSALIENVLDFAKVERGRGPYDFALGDIGEAARRAVNVYRYRAERQQVELQLTLNASSHEAKIDARAIELAIMNLIDNALKYAPDGDIIAVSVAKEGAFIVVRVKDRGPGIPEDEQEKIFERFVRGTTSKTREGSGSPVRGSGIGLSLVKHIAESHGGRAWVESEPGGGSTFALSISGASSSAISGPISRSAPPVA